MIIQIMGATFVLGGAVAAAKAFQLTNKHTEKALHQLCYALELMEYELEYRHLPLPELLKKSAPDRGVIQEFFTALSTELDGQATVEVETSVIVTLSNIKNIPEPVAQILLRLGKCIGHFDIENQVKGIASIRSECALMLKKYTENSDNRIHIHQALALCIGAALIIMLI